MKIKPDEIKAKYGEKLYTVAVDIEIDDNTTEKKEYLFKKPTTVSFDRFVKKLANSTTLAARDFICDNIIEEQLEELKNDIEEYPALALTINDKLTNMLGLSKNVSVKKF